MGNSPVIGQKTDLVSLEVKVGGQLLDGEKRVLSVETERAVGKISRAEITVLDGNLAKQEFKLQDQGLLKPGEDVEIKIGYHQDTETVFKGVILKTGVRIRQGQHSVIYAECVDKAIKMTMARRNKNHKDKKDSDVMQRLISDAGVGAEVESTSTTHKQLIQHYCTDWDFVLSRAEKNGLFVYTEDNKVKVEKPGTSGALLELNFGTDIVKSNLYFNGRTQLKDVTTYSWDPKKQKVIDKKSSEPSVNAHGDLKGKTVANDFNPFDYELRHSGYVEDGELTAWAKAKLVKSRFSRIQGSITVQGSAKPLPNKTVTLKKIGKHFEGEAFVSGVRHMVQEGNWTTELKIGIEAEWFTETKPLVQASAAAGLLPGVEGIYIGKVLKIHGDPDGESRVQVKIPLLEESGEGIWARLAQIYASEEFGAFWYPQVDDEVILGFVQGDPRYPIILGSLYSSKRKTPLQPNSDNSTQAFITKSKLKLRFEDKDKDIFLETPGGQSITLSDKDRKIELKDQHNNVITMDSSGIKIKSHKAVNIEAGMGSKVNIKGPGGVDINSSTGDLKMEGLNMNAKGRIGATFEGGMATFKATGMCTVSGQMVFIN